MPGLGVGGPIRQKKTFFFVKNQWWKAEQPRQRTRLVYTAQARAGNWRYSTAARNQPAGGAGASVDASGNPIVPIGTYSIPGADPQRFGLDPTTQKLIGATPLPNDFTAGHGRHNGCVPLVAPDHG